MNKSAFIFTILASVFSNANTVHSVFKYDSPIRSADLRVKILNSIYSVCGNIVAPYGLHEVKTVTRQQREDSNSPYDVFYTTTFSSRYYHDGMHPKTVYLTVESVEYANLNGQRLVVEKIVSNEGTCEAQQF